MASPWKKQPEVVAETVLKRAEVGKLGRQLKARLALAQFKTAHGWEDLTLDSIEPKVEELRRRRPMSSGDMFSDSSSSTTSEMRYSGSRQLMSSPLKDTTLFSDQIGSRSGSGSSGYRKRTYHNSFEHSGSNGSRKRYCSSPTFGRSVHSSRNTWKNNQFAQSSPIKPRRQAHFTNSSGPGLPFYQGNNRIPEDESTNYAAASDDDDNSLPIHSFNIGSSPPRTPSPPRNRGSLRRNKEKNGKSGEEGADLLLYLATSPSPANPTARASRMQPPSTPPPKNSALPSSVMNTPGGSGGLGLLGGFGIPSTPGQSFDFADFVNITPSPAQSAWPKTPRTAKTPMGITRRGLTFENFQPLQSPRVRDSGSGASKPTTTGLGMQLGGDLIS